jgi:hypothetical protein
MATEFVITDYVKLLLNVTLVLLLIKHKTSGHHLSNWPIL